MSAVPGKLVPPYPVDNCANNACQMALLEAAGAFLFKNRVSGKLVVFCDDCARHAELNAREQFALVEL